MIISIGGTQGSGKSTIAKMIAEELGWKRYYMGEIRRETAKKMGLTLAEYNKLGEDDPSTDLEVDKFQEELGKTKDNFVIEGRTSWHFIPHSLKIYLDVKEDIGAQRIFKNLKASSARNEDKNLNTVRDVLRSTRTRQKSDNKRYKKYFNINVHDKSNYAFYLDTSSLAIEEVFNKTFDFIKKNLKKSSVDKT
jgi:CMP/dCMP kinase